MDPKQLQAMEAPLMALANSAGGDLRKLLYAFFSFLHRRTDFYLVPHEDDLKEGKAKMGFPEGEAEKLLLAAFRQFPLRRIPLQQKAGASTINDAAADAGASSSSRPKTSSTPTNKKQSKETTTDATINTNKPTTSSTEATEKEKEDLLGEKIRYTEEGLQVPVGNGGTTKRYVWTQTLDECTVMLGIPSNLRAKDLDVSIKAASIRVKTKPTGGNIEGTTFVEGALFDKIKPDESTWTIEGGVMTMLLQKPKKTFWATIIADDEKIDTSLVDSRRHISDYDEATQGQLRKIMFDQKQKEKGLPTSDEILGTKTISPLPPGVEYIDKTTFEEADKKKKEDTK